ncbi:MAG TPA: hypothetical protein VFU36_08145 [Jatrophihabitans sp.]|nr:hypothetical protein [Jatrophihabitans sp.]
MARGWRRCAVLVAGLLCWLPAVHGQAQAQPGYSARPASAVTTCSGQLVRNPGFESGAVYWTASPGVITNSSSEPAHSGSWDAVLGILGGTESVSQTISIPAGCHATLSFWLHIDTEETTTTTAYDRLTLKLDTTQIAGWSNLNHNLGYSQQVVAFSGTGTFTITFTATEDSSLLTRFVLDDVTVTLS